MPSACSYAGDSCPKGIAARGALSLRLRRNRWIHHRVLLHFLITVRTIDKERGLLRRIYLVQKPGTN